MQQSLDMLPLEMLSECKCASVCSGERGRRIGWKEILVFRCLGEEGQAWCVGRMMESDSHGCMEHCQTLILRRREEESPPSAPAISTRVPSSPPSALFCFIGRN